MVKLAPFIAMAFTLMALPAQAQDKVTFGTNWLAQGEHGGFYQALADGTYARYGLDVTIRQGGPQSPNRALLTAGQIDFYMGGPSTAIDAVKEGVPTLTLAAIFQKDPQVMLAHPEAGFETLGDLARASQIFMGRDGFLTYFEWMKANFEGFSDEQFRPYTFNPAPFLADPQSAQQGFLTSEPFAIAQQAGFEPTVFLLDDYGYKAYSTTIVAMRPYVEANRDLVQRFIDASIIGWYNYLYADNSGANALIKADNPEMTDAQLAYSRDKMVEYGIVDSGDALTQGIGCMTDANWADFYQRMVSVKRFEPGIDIAQAYDASYVCKGVGLDPASR